MNSKEKKSMGKAGKTLIGIIIVIAILFFAFAAFNMSRAGINSNKNEVTSVTLRNDLVQMDEITPYASEYSGMATITNSRELWGHKIPLTTHEIDVIYEGRIKVNYDLSELAESATVNPVTKTITLKFPKTPDTDNIIDKIETKDHNNILNQIKSNEVPDQIKAEEEKQLKQAVDQGLYDKAEEHTVEIVTEFLKKYGDKYDGYTVKTY